MSRINYAAIIKERVSTREVLEAHGIHVGRMGLAKCPFHADRNASLKVYSDPARGWHCYSCHAGGDVIDFVMRMHGLDFMGAMERIDDAFHLGLPIRQRATQEEARQFREDIQRRKEERERKKAAREAAETAYFAAFETWLRNESIIAEEAPRGPFDAMSEAFIYAITHSAEIRYNLDDAEERWWQARAAG